MKTREAFCYYNRRSCPSWGWHLNDLLLVQRHWQHVSPCCSTSPGMWNPESALMHSSQPSLTPQPQLQLSQNASRAWHMPKYTVSHLLA